MIWSDEIVEKVVRVLWGSLTETYQDRARAVLDAIAADVVPRAVYDALDEVYQQTREALTESRVELEHKTRSVDQAIAEIKSLEAELEQLRRDSGPFRDIPCEDGHELASENGYNFCAKCGHSLTPGGEDALANSVLRSEMKKEYQRDGLRDTESPREYRFVTEWEPLS